MDHRQHVADGEAAWLSMRDARREGGIKAVEIDRQVHRPGDRRPRSACEMLHLDRIDVEAGDLLALMRSQRADANLHEPAAQALFHDAREWAGVRETVAVEL